MNRDKKTNFDKLEELSYELDIYSSDIESLNDEEIDEAIKILEKIKRRRDKGELYINIDDRQGGIFAIGRIGTLKQWREQAIEWFDSENNECLQNKFSKYYIKNKDLIQYINDMFEIEIVKFDKNVDYAKKYDLEYEYMYD